MPIRLSELTARQANLAVDVGGGETLNVVFRPGAITPEVAVIDETTNIDRVYGFFRQVIVSWDLVDDDGVPLPMVDASLARVPLVVLAEVMQAAIMAARPNPRKGAT